MLLNRFEDIRIEKMLSTQSKSLRSSNAEKATNFRRFDVPAINVNVKVYYETTD